MNSIVNKFDVALTEELKNVEFTDFGVATTNGENDSQYYELKRETAAVIGTDAQDIKVFRSVQATIENMRNERTSIVGKEKVAALDVGYANDEILSNTFTMFEREARGVYMLEAYYDHRCLQMGISVKLFSNEEYENEKRRGLTLAVMKDKHYKHGDIFKDIVLDTPLIDTGILQGTIQLDTQFDSDEESYLAFLRHIYSEGILSYLKKYHTKK